MTKKDSVGSVSPKKITLNKRPTLFSNNSMLHSNRDKREGSSKKSYISSEEENNENTAGMGKFEFWPSAEKIDENSENIIVKEN